MVCALTNEVTARARCVLICGGRYVWQSIRVRRNNALRVIRGKCSLQTGKMPRVRVRKMSQRVPRPA